MCIYLCILYEWCVSIYMCVNMHVNIYMCVLYVCVCEQKSHSFSPSRDPYGEPGAQERQSLETLLHPTSRLTAGTD